jgi:hypothetical protein
VQAIWGDRVRQRTPLLDHQPRASKQLGEIEDQPLTELHPAVQAHHDFPPKWEERQGLKDRS